MKEFIIRRNSWHFKLVKHFGKDEWMWRNPKSLCEYVNRVIASIFGMVFAVAMAIIISAVVLYPTGDFIGWLVAGLATRFVVPNAALVIIAFIILFVGFTACYFTVAAAQKMQEAAKNIEPGFLTMAYRQFKEKTCVKVKVV